MSNANTDQVNRNFDAAVIANPTAATITYFQRSAPVAQQRGVGASNLEVPGQYKGIYNKVKVRAYGSSKLATVASQALTITINAVNSASAIAVIATSGPVACATMAGAVQGWYLEVEFLLDVNSAAVLAGEFQGNTPSGSSSALVARTILAAQPGFTRTNIPGTSTTQGLDENQFFQVAITQAIADATAVHTLLQFSTEIL